MDAGASRARHDGRSNEGKPRVVLDSAPTIRHV
jgi:hypothetical protein